MGRKKKLINKKVFKNSAKKCRICGASDYCTLHVHRINPGKNSGKYNPENCVAVCSNCHAKIHDGQIEIDRYYTATNGINMLRIIIDDEEKFI